MVLTGKRGGFGAMKPMLRQIDQDPDLHLQLVATDQHVSERFGNTIDEIREDFEVAATVDMEQADDTPVSRAQALGLCAQRMSLTLDELKPDICLLYGDRGEVLASAMAATVLGLPIGHIQGGDVSGSLDDQVRHAITKLSHLHFPSIPSSADRLRRMGEEEWRIHVVGDNHIDEIIAGAFMDRAQVAELLELDLSKPIVVVLQHSETTEPEKSYAQMVETMAAVRSTGHQTVVVYPCSDQGYEGIIEAITEFGKEPQLRVHVNLDAPVFWGLLATASVLVGNSSAGLIETPSFRLPAINIGRRQIGRMRSNNVLDVEHDRKAIAEALNKALFDEDFRGVVSNCAQPYGDGLAGSRIVEVLKGTTIDERLLVKRMTY